LGYSDVVEAQKPDRKSQTGGGERICLFSLNITKKSVRQIHKYEFFLKVVNVKVYFCEVHWILCFLLHPGMFTLAL